MQIQVGEVAQIAEKSKIGGASHQKIKKIDLDLHLKNLKWEQIAVVHQLIVYLM